jgi:gp16 family phage-associated protein
MKNASFQCLPYPQTPETAAMWFQNHGVCISHWSRHFGFARMAVVDLLRGKCKGRWGHTHEVAVALGLKPAPDASSLTPKGTPHE